MKNTQKMKPHENLELDDMIIDGKIEEWKYFEPFDMFVSSFGRVKRPLRIKKHNYGGVKIIKERMRRQCLSKSGYLGMHLIHNGEKKFFRVNRLVATCFVPNPENKPQVNHLNGIKTDNRPDNLEWCTAKENVIHAHSTGLACGLSGEDNPMCKLTDSEVINIRYAYSIGVAPVEICSVTDVSRSYCTNLCRERKRKDLVLDSFPPVSVDSKILDRLFKAHKDRDYLTIIYYTIFGLIWKDKQPSCTIKDIYDKLNVSLRKDRISFYTIKLENMQLIHILRGDSTTSPNQFKLTQQFE